jgi:hypothetical protein
MIIETILESGSIDIGYSVLFLTRCPADSFPHLKFIVVPHLYLIFSRIASHQKLISEEIYRVPCDVRPEHCTDTLAHTEVPLMEDAVPSAGD